MKLGDVIASLEQFPDEAVILAEAPWTADSLASVEEVHAADYTKLSRNGQVYFMTVFMARINKDGFVEHGLEPGNAIALCDALIARAQLLPTRFDPPRPELPVRNIEPLNLDGTPPAVSDGYVSVWILDRADHLADRIREMGYGVSAANDRLTVELAIDTDEAIAMFFSAMRDLGFVFGVGAPKGWSPIATVRALKRDGLLVGEFDQLVRVRNGKWRRKSI